MSKQQTKQQEEVSEATQEIPVLSVDESLSVTERFTDNAINNILPARYLVKDENGDVTEEPDELFERVADNVATAEYQFADEQGLSYSRADERFNEWSAEFEELMKTQRFMPNSPTLMNAGARLQQLSACFVDSPQDDLYDIAETEKEWTLVQKTGGGMGADFSTLRPKGTLISTTKGVSSGPVSFMQKFNLVAGVIKQGGVRRGAQMAELRADHPDVGRFAVAKRVEGALDNFNISVSVTDEFIEAVENDETYTLYSPQSEFEEPFKIVEETAEFYAPSYQNYPEGEGTGCVKQNIWRDFADEIDAWDWEEGETVSFRDKWEDKFELAEESGQFDVGEQMELPARFIWDIILDGAWRNGEPGLFHLDETRRKHSFDGDEHEKYQIYGTNPCVVSGTMVNTPSGPERVESIEEGDKISTTRGSEVVDEILSFDDETVYNVELSDGGSLTVTEDHRFHVLDGKNVSDKPLRDIEEGEYIRLHPSNIENGGSDKQYRRQLRRGILVGDGCYTEDTIKHNNRLSISTSEADEAYNKQLVELFEDAGYSVTEDKSNPGKSMKYWVGPADEILSEHALNPAKSHEKTVDTSQFDTEAQIIGFLDGLLASDGNVNLSTNRPQLRWTSSSDELVQDIRTLALNIGAHARIYEDQRKQRVGQRNDGSKILGERSISDVHIAGESLREYANKSRLDDIHPSKGSLLREAQDSWALTGGSWKATVKSIEKVSDSETVYDLYCSDSDTWITEGYVQRGCAEQPLCEYEACNLGHINLSLMVEDNAPTHQEFVNSTDYDYDTTSAEMYDYFEEAVDFDELDRVIESGTRFLDNVVTMSDFPLEEIEETVSEMRKIGLGVMGWAQMCYQMGVRYGSEESLQLGRIVMNYIDEQATKTSHDLAIERGKFDAWEHSKYADPTAHSEWFWNHVYDIPEEWEDGYPIRNHNVTTVAPTGTTSMLGDTSGGIEPVYNVAYKKNVGGDIQGDTKLIEFDDVFIETLEANEADLDHTVEEIKEICAKQMDNNEFDGISGLPVPEWMKETFVTTNDLTAREHGLMQRAFQEGVDSGISKTVNLPADSTHSDVHDAYMLAVSDDELGATIKGLTVYRDQSREEQVLTTQEYSDLEVENAVEMLRDLDGYSVEVTDDE